MISASLVVMSSSVLAFSWATDGRMQIGGAGRYCQRNISGRPSEGSRPSSSQSLGLTFLKRFNTRNGFRSSNAFRKCLSRSGVYFFAIANEASNARLLSGGNFFAEVDLLKAENRSWTSFMGLNFLMLPLMAWQ